MGRDDHGRHQRPLEYGEIRRLIGDRPAGHRLQQHRPKYLIDEVHHQHTHDDHRDAARDSHQKYSPWMTDAITDSTDAASRPTAIAR